MHYNTVVLFQIKFKWLQNKNNDNNNITGTLGIFVGTVFGNSLFEKYLLRKACIACTFLDNF